MRLGRISVGARGRAAPGPAGDHPAQNQRVVGTPGRAAGATGAASRRSSTMPEQVPGFTEALEWAFRAGAEPDTGDRGERGDGVRFPAARAAGAADSIGTIFGDGGGLDLHARDVAGGVNQEVVWGRIAVRLGDNQAERARDVQEKQFHHLAVAFEVGERRHKIG